MQFAWFDSQLEECCISRSRLRAAVGGSAGAAEDLLHVVSQAPRLQDLATFKSVRIDVSGGSLTLSIEEIDMHAKPLNSEGVPRDVHSRATLPLYAQTQALFIQDLRVRGQSILRLAS